VSELGKNTETLTRLGQGLATILRDQRIKILSGLFAPQNIDTTIDEGLLTNLYVEKIEWFADSKIWDDFNERRRAEEACAAIIRFVERTRSAVESLGDTQGQRYKIESRTYDANLDILRKIAVVDVSQLANLYHRMNDARVLYNRIVAGSLEYMSAVRQFCAALPPDRSTLGSALALERLTFRMLPSYRQKIDDLLTVIKREIEQLQQA
jgi:hypothetical protein